MAQLCSWYKEIDLLHVVSDRAHLGCWNIWQKHLLLGELCSLSVGLKVLFKGNSNQWVVDVMQKVFCRNPRHNGFGLLKSFILFYRWRSLAGSWAKNQTQVSGDISEAFFVLGQSDCLLTWLQNSPVCWTVISVPRSSLLIVVSSGCPEPHSEVLQSPRGPVPHSIQEALTKFWWGISGFAARAHTLFFTLSSISHFDLSALLVVTVGMFWCFLLLLRYIYVFFLYVTKLLSWLWRDLEPVPIF